MRVRKLVRIPAALAVGLLVSACGGTEADCVRSANVGGKGDIETAVGHNADSFECAPEEFAGPKTQTSVPIQVPRQSNTGETPLKQGSVPSYCPNCPQDGTAPGGAVGTP